MEDKSLKYRTDFLLPKNNFWAGLGSVLNIAGSYYEYNTSDTTEEADYKAMRSDWGMVGKDIEEARNAFKIKNRKSLNNLL